MYRDNSGISISQDVNMTIILGEVISDIKAIDNSKGKMVTFMVEVSKKVFSEKQKSMRITKEKHKIVCFDSIAQKVESDIVKGDTVHIFGCNRSKPIVANKETEQKVISRDVVAKQVSIIKGQASQHFDSTILMGKVISDLKVIDNINGHMVTFMLETEERFFSESHQKIKSSREKHKIVCFDGVAKKISDCLKLGDSVYIFGSNRSKLIVADKDTGKKVISRDVVAKQIALIN